MADLHVDFLGKRLAGPVIAASGTFGFGPEYAGIEDLRVLGGISGKGLTLNGQPGNEGERLYETPSGLMNSIGLQNPGVCSTLSTTSCLPCAGAAPPSGQTSAATRLKKTSRAYRCSAPRAWILLS